MEPFIADWLNFVIRWGHMVAGIAWIGTSFYFVALDFSLKTRDGLPPGVRGEAWEVHGGGFYHVQKYLSAPPRLPEHLTWFKWEAYLTWVTGFFLLAVVYYVNARANLIDPAVANLAPWQAIIISLVSIVAGWAAYDGLCRSPIGQKTGLLAACVFALILGFACLFTHVFSGRGAFIHVGVITGTIMAANVFMVIIPNQRKITRALIRGEAPDPRLGATGKQRSLHNTYLTLPVLLMMVSNHFAMLTDAPQAWLLVGLIFTGGAALRHFLVRHEVGDPLSKTAWTLPVIFLSLGGAWLLSSSPLFSLDWANLFIRWGHIIAGTAWIGASFYFVALDFSLRKEPGMPAGVGGEVWEVHGGGFYRVRKYLTAPETLPKDLIWFKWEAYLTWVTGFLLLVVLYYLQADSYLIDPNVLPLDPWQAIGLSVASLALGWVLYTALCKPPLGSSTGLLATVLFVMLLAFAYGYTHMFSGRGAFIHIGALIGTIMAANVFMVIIPNQRRITAALLKGETPDPRLGATGKQRSLHNTYLTLPVLAMMVSNHFPMITDSKHAWLLAGLIILAGGLARHFLVRTEVGDAHADIAWTLPLIGAALAIGLIVTQPSKLVLFPGEVPDAEALSIVRTRCAACHAEYPTDATIKVAPKGVHLETLEQLKRYSAQVWVQAVANKAMPLANRTGITDEERAKLGTWIARQ
ncbi:urate hydroxylase PuuD [Aestuariivirga sp.]|uniref:urate hydroxylase PuuD n=1 Tax=Aestuariivirga sp. TaxID=2650926 RepID=UPI0025BFD489|nr:urate hydroxylase PuuD [Aestuariivirga sp.]